jgi:hypothetical protein
MWPTGHEKFDLFLASRLKDGELRPIDPPQVKSVRVQIRPAVIREDLSPAARAVYDRLISGTYEVDLDGLIDALLSRFEDGSEAVTEGGPPGRAPASLSSAR